MKKQFIIVALIVLVTTLTGCLSTLHPLFTEKDLIFDPRLIGTWGSGDEESFQFEQGTAASFHQLPEHLRGLAGKAYIVTYKDEDDPEEILKFYAFLTRLGNELYLDYYPFASNYQMDYNPFYMQHLVRMHSFYRIRFLNDKSFEIGQFNDSFLKGLIDNKQIRIKHEVRYDGSYVITAPTEDLQQYVLKYGGVPEAYQQESISTYTKLK